MKTKTSVTNPLIRLYNAIKQDHSIRRYTLIWTDIIEAIDRRYKNGVPVISESFENSLLLEAISTSNGSMKEKLQAFARELNIGLQTLSDKDTKPQLR